MVGVWHRDFRGRPGLALDAMEASRPAVDRYIFELLRRRVFSVGDFFQTAKGSVRVLPPLTHQLAETLPTWGRLVAPVAERVAAMLADASGSAARRLTPLTGENRLRGREGMRRRPRKIARSALPRPPAACQDCGAEVPSLRRRLCDACTPRTPEEQFEEHFAGSGLSRLVELKANGRDPTHGGAAATRRGKSIAERKRAIREWERQFGKVVDLSSFEREILPLIRNVPLSRLVKATGLSLRYCSQIRRGERVPHPRHWQALLEAADGREQLIEDGEALAGNDS